VKPQKTFNVYNQHCRKINGWFSKEAASLFALLNELQRENDIEGDLFEIGTHHGKSAVLLACMAQPGRESLGICDLFGDQSENVSASGGGDQAIFKENIRKLSLPALEINTFWKNSQNLKIQEIGQNFRFFHVDGGHNCNEALSDLKLAALVILPEGVIVVDDPFRPEWPGVTEAIIRFLDQHDDFTAILVGFNKLILVRKESARIYSDAISKTSLIKSYNLGYPWHLKELPFHKSKISIFYRPSWIPKSRFFTQIKRIRKVLGQYS
jgi:SAM-dependent methyltransferase